MLNEASHLVTPASRHRMVNLQQVKHPGNQSVNELFDRSRTCVKPWTGGTMTAPHCDNFRHVAQMNPAERRFAHNQYEPPTFLQTYICRARNKVGRTPCAILPSVFMLHGIITCRYYVGPACNRRGEVHFVVRAVH